MSKKIIYLLTFLLITQPVFAHPPSNIQVQYSKSNNEIIIIVNHRIGTGGHVKNRTHFIKEIVLNLNGKITDTKTFTYQNNSSIVKASFPLPKFESNDQLSLKAICSTGNELSKDILVNDLIKYQPVEKINVY